MKIKILPCTAIISLKWFFIFPTLKSFLLCSLLYLKNNTNKSNITVEKYGYIQCIIKCVVTRGGMGVEESRRAPMMHTTTRTIYTIDQETRTKYH